MSYLKSIVKFFFGLFFLYLGPQNWPFQSPRLVVLTYHRTLPESDVRYSREQPGMVVTPETFENHLRWMKQAGFTFTTLDEWRKGNNKKQKKMCVITFDDGWHDNYEYAFPVLQRHQVPFTLFLVSELLATGGGFWPGALTHIVSVVHQKAVQESGYRLGDSEAERWLIELLPSGWETTELGVSFYDDLIVAAKSFSDQEIWQNIHQLCAIVNIDLNECKETVQIDDVNDMLKSGLLTIGSHSATHMRLGKGVLTHDIEVQVAASRRSLEDKFSVAVDSFCFPNGDYCDESLAVVKKNYSTAVTTLNGWNHFLSNLHELRRVSVHEDATKTKAHFWAAVSSLM